MSLRLFAATLFCLLFAAACGGARGRDKRDRPPPDPTVSLDWLRDRPSVTPWGSADAIPANRKPRWFCFTDIADASNSICAATVGECETMRGRGKCEPHLRAACAEGLDGCFPTIAICELVRNEVAKDQGPRTQATISACQWHE